MLPIRCIFSVGCVILTIVLPALALGLRAQEWKLASAQIELGERPEWQQLVILSAIQRRADELNSLRQLPDTPPRTDDEAAPPKVSLPAAPTDRTPPQVKPRARMKSAQHVRHRARPLANREPPRVQNVFEFPFGNQAPTLSSNNYFLSQQAGQTTPAEKRLQAPQVTSARMKQLKIKNPKAPAATRALDGTF